MPRTSYKVYDTAYPYFVTCSIVDWLPLFSIREIAEVVLKSLSFHQENRKLSLFAYVIMENHIHLIAQSTELQKNMRTFKSYTARQIIDILKTNGHRFYLNKLRKLKLSHHSDSMFQVWQEGYHPKQLVGEKMIKQKINYIHHNPVNRGYVNKPEHWRYSSAQNYIGNDGLLTISRIW